MLSLAFMFWVDLITESFPNSGLPQTQFKHRRNQYIPINLTFEVTLSVVSVKQNGREFPPGLETESRVFLFSTSWRYPPYLLARFSSRDRFGQADTISEIRHLSRVRKKYFPVFDVVRVPNSDRARSRLGCHRLPQQLQTSLFRSAIVLL